MLYKRPKYKIKDTNLLAPTLLNSLKDFTIAFRDKLNSRQKQNPYLKVTPRKLKDYIAIKQG